MNNISVKVMVNEFDGSLAAPNARYDVIIYYAAANSDNFVSAGGLKNDSVASTAAYFTRKCMAYYTGHVVFYDYIARTYYKYMFDGDRNFSTVFYCGQFKSKESVLSFMEMLRSGAENLDILGKVNLIFEGHSPIVKEFKELITV